MSSASLPGYTPRLALGCMRLSTDDDADEARAVATIEAALDAGVAIFDTARAYARDEAHLGDNERLLARVLRGRPDARERVRVVTKGGMRRPAGRWEPDGRARTLREDCEASLDALGGVPIDLYLVHAPDPRVPWATTVRALASLARAGLVRRVGVSNVNRRQLDEAMTLAPIEAVEIALSPFVETALRGGVVARCLGAGIEVLAHAPLGGPDRAAKLARDETLAAIAARHGVSAQRVALAALTELHARVVPVVGARRPETVRASAAPLDLDDEDRALLKQRFGWSDVLAPVPPPEGDAAESAEVVLVMGLQGAGKTTLAGEWVARGYERLNRDERAGSMADLHRALDARLGAGARRVVADNTYTTRATRQVAIETARRHGARVVGVWLDTPLVEAQTNVILRMLDAHGRLLEPDEMVRARDPSALAPTAVLRLLRELEPPALDEGFTSLDEVAFARRAREGHDRVAELVHLDAAEQGARPRAELGLVFGWRPGLTEDERARMAATFGAPVRCCVHGGGPPRCWCRPPLPGLLVEFARQNRVDLSRSVVVGTKATHAAIARAVGATYREA